MPKRKFTGRYLPLAVAGAQMAYRAYSRTPHGGVRQRIVRRRSRRVRSPSSDILRRYVRMRQRLHQAARQAGNGGSFSCFYYGRRKRPFMRGYAVNPTQYYAMNSAGAISINVGLQSVNTINCLYGCVANAISTDLDNITIDVDAVFQ